ncbi:hypothetical protein K432DRAFT_392166 [Lepidopterella palustris CBS 459.81]|uniref:Uncharacterized protein n=1 Tax=Lepidopterella palustris CBS 459.81 TaxID=1314670 RepID=A0A8E2ECN6_9PEZI|nr:hypothetical protein K432DRAFT_392166 [Lepidopterella palustris CBS 459.81]
MSWSAGGVFDVIGKERYDGYNGREGWRGDVEDVVESVDYVGVDGAATISFAISSFIAASFLVMGEVALLEKVLHCNWVQFGVSTFAISIFYISSLGAFSPVDDNGAWSA